MPSRILHPESDWLWLWSEMGWCAVALVLIFLGLLLRRIFPLARGSGRQLRLAAGVAALVFAIHGIVDVPGHRLGSALPGLFALALALNNCAVLRENRWIPICFRVAAAACGVVGTTWLFASWQGNILPGSIGVAEIKHHAQSLNAEGRYSMATVETTRAVRWAPLDWELYYIRGMAEVCDGNWPRTFDDFRRVNILESTSPLVPFEVGKIWLGSRPSYAIPAWEATLRRCPPQEAPQYYEDMLQAAARIPGLRGLLRPLAKGRPELEIVYLNNAPAEEVRAAINTILQRDPGLHSFPDQMKPAFFQLWTRNDATGLVRQFSTKPPWQGEAWRQVSAYLASQGDLQGACQMVFEFMPQPEFPKIILPGGIDDLHQRLLLHPDDFLAGYALCTALMDQKNDVMAMQVVRSFTASPECPKYFHFIEAKIAFRMQDYKNAWSALKKYEPALE